ncbi:hypothetical protein [Roseospirillum parvum]|uniref:Uncharacterized protein n=1 Tax=Roseospirillum parvum TaxID=83401 RepID=A0A1G8DUH9_9PROT|nr:hypothetical protein [Roseospirillum parvum]SDH61231.1 hypothetical protein SAMN05421742_108121 [Roseospirillum parvum]
MSSVALIHDPTAPRPGSPATQSNRDTMARLNRNREAETAALPGTFEEAGGGQAKVKPFGDDGLTFWDVLDIINPLQHLPVISTFYREWTGDQIDALPRIVGGGIFGGPLGVAASVVNTVIEGETGDDLGGHVMTALFGPDTPATPDAAPATRLAEAAADRSADLGATAQPGGSLGGSLGSQIAAQAMAGTATPHPLPEVTPQTELAALTAGEQSLIPTASQNAQTAQAAPAIPIPTPQPDQGPVTDAKGRRWFPVPQRPGGGTSSSWRASGTTSGDTLTVPPRPPSPKANLAADTAPPAAPGASLGSGIDYLAPAAGTATTAAETTRQPSGIDLSSRLPAEVDATGHPMLGDGKGQITPAFYQAAMRQALDKYQAAGMAR